MNATDKAVLVLDCGATNVRAIAINRQGQILASCSQPNQTVADPNYPGGLIWDVEELWQKISSCSKKALSGLKNIEIAAVTVTTFGVDGAAMMKDGSLVYPVISWQCDRTIPVMENIGKYIETDRLCNITGLNTFHFNTINKLVWLKENKPEVIRTMDYYVLLSSVFLHKLSGEFVTDASMAGTSMLTELRTRSFSVEVLSALGLTKELFPRWVEAGEIVGQVTPSAAADLGITAGALVVAAGHDTQFAVFGSGARINEPVLSSGTWEILMVRTPVESLNFTPVGSGITVELDAQPGLADAGIQWIASGVLEWVSRIFFNDLANDKQKYEKMIGEAQGIPAGSEGVILTPELFGQGFSGKPGTLSGLRHDVTRGHIYRAALESLSYYARFGLKRLEASCGFKADSVICVGGGTKNRLWNQIKADVLGIPVKISHRKETTVLGAALFAMPAAGLFDSLEEACKSVSADMEIILPGKDSALYYNLYRDYCSSIFNS